ncbi:MAG: ABC transporter permease, partial [Anaerolineae bacterium]
MRKAWLIATSTYRRRVRSGTFLILTFGLPVMMVIAGAIPVIRARDSELPNVGYVDETGRLVPVTQVSIADAPLTLMSYSDTADARAAFQRGDIAGYLVIPEGYLQGQSAVFYGQQEPAGNLQDALTAFMRRAMLRGEPDWLLGRLANPARVTYVARDSGVEISEGPALFLRVAFPAILALIFAFAVITSPGQMGSVMVHEKDQRSMEIIITSMSPRELVAGKVLGMSLLSLTQVTIWALGGGIAASLALSSSVDLQSLSIPWHAVIWALLLGVPGYFLQTVLAAGVGIIAGDTQQAEQLTGIVGFLIFVPLILLGPLVNTPDGPLAVGLTLFPFTGPIVGLIRMALTEVPTWQLVASLTLIITSLAGSIWVVARIFRAAMLMYGRALRPRQVWEALR